MNALNLSSIVGVMSWELGVDSLVVVVSALLGVGVVGPVVGVGGGDIELPDRVRAQQRKKAGHPAEHVALQARWQEIAEQGDEDEKQRKPRRTPKGDLDSPTGRFVLDELADHRDWHAQCRVPSLIGVQPFELAP